MILQLALDVVAAWILAPKATTNYWAVAAIAPTTILGIYELPMYLAQQTSIQEALSIWVVGILLCRAIIFLRVRQ